MCIPQCRVQWGPCIKELISEESSPLTFFKSIETSHRKTAAFHPIPHQLRVLPYSGYLSSRLKCLWCLRPGMGLLLREQKTGNLNLTSLSLWVHEVYFPDYIF